jgi:hypothetical protein
VPKQLPPELRELAAHQCGILTTEQVVRGGLTRSAIAAHLRAGRWQRIHRGVYATFSGEPGRLAILWAAVLSAGPGAVLSHQTAAELAGLTDRVSDLIHVTVPVERRPAKMGGLVIHYSARALQARHPARLPPQTRVEETILDLANAARTVDDACAWVFRGLQRRKTTQANLAGAIEHRARMRWRPELSELLTLDAAGLHSILERRYHKDVERPHGLPAGERQRRYRRGDHNEYRDVFYAADRCSKSRNFATTGPSVGPPSPPSTVTMANAMSLANTSLLKPISQASVGSGLPWPYCAVPVLA